MSAWHGGKGGTRRKALVSPAKVGSNWNAIFGKKAKDAQLENEVDGNIDASQNASQIEENFNKE